MKRQLVLLLVLAATAVAEPERDRQKHNIDLQSSAVFRANSAVADTMPLSHIDSIFINSPFVKYRLHPRETTLTTIEMKNDETIGGFMLPDFRDSTRHRVLPGPADPLARQLGEDNTANASNFLLGMLGKWMDKQKQKPANIRVVPSRTEVEVLNTLWQQGASTNVDIYAALDSSVKITAEELERVLSGMTKRRMLQRVQVSPQLPLALGGPDSPFAIEMSAQNRRNRVYQYKTQMSPQQLITFLNAKAYKAEKQERARIQFLLDVILN